MRHISFSQLKNWAKCPFYHKLANIDKVAGAFSGNIYTAFGSALHEAIENHLEENVVDEHLQEFFEEAYNTTNIGINNNLYILKSEREGTNGIYISNNDFSDSNRGNRGICSNTC